MPPRADLQWIELTDFSPGIFSNNNLAGGLNVTSTNLALASPANTYRCRSLPTGGLGPLPRMQESFGITTPPATGNGYTYYIHGLGTWGQVFNSPSADTNFDHRIEVHLPVSYTTGGTYNNVFKWLRERIYAIPQSTETILTDTNTDGVPERVQYAFMLKTRINHADPNLPGNVVMVGVFSNYGQGIRIAQAHPNPATPTVASTLALGPDASIENYITRRAVAHQGRVVFARYDAQGRGDGTTISTDENLYWTETNDSDLVSTTAAVFVPEQDASVTDMISMTANQLVVIKALGGGYTLNGDLSDVTMVRLPNLMSPDGSDTVAGCNTGIGMVYSAGDRGLWVWNGGDAARPLSPQLDGTVFAETNGVTFGEDSHRGQCDRWMDLLLAPNLWVCDLEREGWWRLDDPDATDDGTAIYPTPPVWMSSSKFDQMAIGARSTFTDSTDDRVFYLYQYGDLAYSYSWQSHPIWLSQARAMTVREGIVALQGHGQVTVTVFDVTNEQNVSTQVLDVDSEVIVNRRFNIGLTAENLAIRFEAAGWDETGTPGTGQAPLIHRAFFGWMESSNLANANN